MKQVWAIARLTLAEGIRMRVVLVCLIVLLLLIVRMPFVLRGDETVAGRLQNFLSYSLAALGAFLSVATIFFSCATLSNELRDKSLHMVVTKPVSRLRILLGKWLGVNLLALLVLAPCGAAIYGFAQYIRTRQVAFERDRLQVRDVVWTARTAANPVKPVDEFMTQAESWVNERQRTGLVSEDQKRNVLMDRLRQIENEWRAVPSGGTRVYEFARLKPPEGDDTVVQIRYKIRGTPLPEEELVPVYWAFLHPEEGYPLHEPVLTRERSGDRHQFLVNARAIIQEGKAMLAVINPPNPMLTDPTHQTIIYFDGDDSLQILYKAGDFGANLFKALLIIAFQIAMLSALGIFFSTFVSFPVACLCGSVFYLICLAMPFVLEATGANMDPQVVLPSYDPYGVFGPAVRTVLVPLLYFGFPDFTRYSGTNFVVDGRYIPLEMLGEAGVRLLLFGAVLLLVPGLYIFQRREIAEVTV
ncbi:MAG: hypothetical protein IPM18_07165 [Phycisphaerales bacterium]|nr:hypothetical protein [Phycisphaerales bacterium]